MYLYPEGNLRTLIWKSQTTSFTNSQEIYNIGTTFKESQLTGRITCADFNKDGKSDIGLVTTDTTTKGAAYVFTSTGTVCNAPTKWWDTKNATSYKYNANGIRTQKTVNGVVTDYYLEGNNVIYEKTGSSIIYYTYDSAGRVVGINDNGTQYYYIRNAQEDIIGILNSSFGVVAQYRYDSWGKIVSICDNAGNDISGNISHIGNKNPYRYRGYRYDTETGLYYLQSRYYNPEWGRFINFDNYGGSVGELLSHNGYNYCKNNPINMVDSNGNVGLAVISLGIILLALMVIVVAIPPETNQKLGESLVELGNIVGTAVEQVWTSVVKSTTKSNSKTKVQTTTEVATKTKTEKKDEIQYWIANKNAKPMKSIDYAQAKMAVLMGNNILCKSQAAAYEIAKDYPNNILEGPHGGDGYFYHYHINDKHGAPHIWFYIGGM